MMVTYILWRFFRLISSMPISVITRFGSIFMAWPSASWFFTMKRTVSAEMPSRRATSASLEPMSIRSTSFSKRYV